MRLGVISFILFTLLGIDAFAQSYRRNVSFEWDAIPDAGSYEIELKLPKKEKTKEKIFNFKVKEPIWSGKLAPAKYAMRLRARDQRGVPGAWSEPSDFNVFLDNVQMKFPSSQAKLQSKNEDKMKIPLSWAPVGGATGYQVEVTSEDGKFKLKEQTKKSQYEIEVPVAQKYTWQVIAYLEDKNEEQPIQSESATANNFTVLGPTLSQAKVEAPESEFVREVKWKKIDTAEAYDVHVLRYDKPTKKWLKVQSFQDYKETTLPFDQNWQGGKYQVLVRSKGNLRAPSSLSKASFDVVSGNRSPAAEYTALVRKSIDRVTGWYAIASYLITQLDYNSTVLDYGSQIKYNTLGGTGRIGAGWLSPTSPWGFIAIVDMSGFSLEGKTQTFASTEMNSIYRMGIGDRGDLRFQAGAFYKEIPATIRQKNTADQVIYSSDSAIKAAGPHLGAEYWYSISPKLGFQINAHMYMSMLKMSTPNGQDLSSSLSTQFGLLGSYRFSPRLTGLMGYARREEKLSYKKDPNSAYSGTGDNTTEISGNYLNFFAEWSF